MKDLRLDRTELPKDFFIPSKEYTSELKEKYDSIDKTNPKRFQTDIELEYENRMKIRSLKKSIKSLNGEVKSIEVLPKNRMTVQQFEDMNDMKEKIEGYKKNLQKLFDKFTNKYGFEVILPNGNKQIVEMMSHYPESFVMFKGYVYSNNGDNNMMFDYHKKDKHYKLTYPIDFFSKSKKAMEKITNLKDKLNKFNPDNTKENVKTLDTYGSNQIIL